jgi:hypothetical protein
MRVVNVDKKPVAGGVFSTFEDLLVFWNKQTNEILPTVMMKLVLVYKKLFHS